MTDNSVVFILSMEYLILYLFTFLRIRFFLFLYPMIYFRYHSMPFFFLFFFFLQNINPRIRCEEISNHHVASSDERRIDWRKNDFTHLQIACSLLVSLNLYIEHVRPCGKVFQRILFENNRNNHLGNISK